MATDVVGISIQKYLECSGIAFWISSLDLGLSKGNTSRFHSNSASMICTAPSMTKAKVIFFDTRVLTWQLLYVNQSSSPDHPGGQIQVLLRQTPGGLNQKYPTFQQWDYRAKSELRRKVEVRSLWNTFTILLTHFPLALQRWFRWGGSTKSWFEKLELSQRKWDFKQVSNARSNNRPRQHPRQAVSILELSWIEQSAVPYTDWVKQWNSNLLFR